MTRAELVELLTVERFAPWRPPVPVERPVRRRPRPLPVPVVLDPLDVIAARRRALVAEAHALWHDDADRALDPSPPDERSA